MTASQQPDAEHAPLTSPAAAGSGTTGHGKAVLLVADAMEQSSLLDDAHEVLAALRAALAAGDAGVERFSPRFVDEAEALGGRIDEGPCNGRCRMVACDDEHRAHRMEWRNLRRFVTDWTDGVR